MFPSVPNGLNIDMRFYSNGLLIFIIAVDSPRGNSPIKLTGLLVVPFRG